LRPRRKTKKAASEETRERLFELSPEFAGLDELLIALLADFALAFSFNAAGMGAVFSSGFRLVAAGFCEYGRGEQGEGQGGNGEEFGDVHSGDHTSASVAFC
jgi:hypothetical protein